MAVGVRLSEPDKKVFKGVDKMKLESSEIEGMIWEFGNLFVCENGREPTRNEYYKAGYDYAIQKLQSLTSEEKVEEIKDILEEALLNGAWSDTNMKSLENYKTLARQIAINQAKELRERYTQTGYIYIQTVDKEGNIIAEEKVLKEAGKQPDDKRERIKTGVRNYYKKHLAVADMTLKSPAGVEYVEEIANEIADEILSELEG